MHALLSLVIAISFTSPAFAYIDPGTGSLLLQVLIGGAVSGLAAVALWWQKLRAFFRGNKNGGDGAP